MILRVNTVTGRAIEAPVAVWILALISALPGDEQEVLFRFVEATVRQPLGAGIVAPRGG